jgi:hypothetical protein
MARRYDIVDQQMRAARTTPPMLAHAAWEEDGHFQIANVWASEEDANSANLSPQFLAALESAGISLEAAEVEQTELHNFFAQAYDARS